jgi:protein-tyrosine phosphatase
MLFFGTAIVISQREVDNYSLIEPGLYMGGCVARPPRGVTAVLNLCELEDSFEVEFHLWRPMVDGEPGPSLKEIRECVEFVDLQRSAGLPTFVHCRNGVSRSGMVVVAYLMYKNDWTRDRALEFVRGKRPITRPSAVLMERLLEWERELQSRQN